MVRRTAWVLSLLMLLGALGAPAGANQQTDSRIQPFVRKLIEANPDARLSLIVQVSSLSEPQAQRVRSLNGRVTGYLKFLSAFRVELPARAIRELAVQDDIRLISYDTRVRPTGLVEYGNLATAYPFAVAADQVWSGIGGPAATGRGVRVAVIDTGVTPLPDLPDTTHVIINGGTNNSTDHYGHGTHIAGIIAGTGQGSGGKYMGVAPAAGIVSLKVSDDAGMATEYDVIKALEWVYHNGAQHSIRVVNLSLTSTLAQGYDTSPLCAAVERLWAAGTVVVVASGNRGSDPHAMHYPPANDPYVITVGAVSDMGTPDTGDDSERDWSARGLTQHLHVKPDVMAPGSRIISLLSSPQAYIPATYPDLIVDGTHLRLGGTSMAAPVLSGVIALMLEADPSLTPDQVKWIVMRSTRPFLYQTLQEPGVIRADTAAYYSRHQTPESANQGLTPSAGLGTGGEGSWDTAYWNTAYWNTAYWTNAWSE